MIIKKATRLPEEVEYFVWDGDAEELPNWDNLEIVSVPYEPYVDIVYRRLNKRYHVNKGCILYKKDGGEIRTCSHSEFEAKFLPNVKE